MKNLLTILLLISVNHLAFAATLTWTGLGGDMNFANVLNWDAPPTGGLYVDDYVIGPGFSSIANPITNVSGFILSISLTDAYVTVASVYMIGALTMNNSQATISQGGGMYISLDNLNPAPFAVELINNSHLVNNGNLWTQHSLIGVKVLSSSLIENNATGVFRPIVNYTNTSLLIDSGTFENHGMFESSKATEMIIVNNNGVVNNYGRIEQLFFPLNNGDEEFVEYGIVLNNGSTLNNFDKIVIGSVKQDAILVKNDGNASPKTKFTNYFEVYASPCDGANCIASSTSAVLKVDPNGCATLIAGSTIFIQEGPPAPAMPMPYNFTTSNCISNNGTSTIPLVFGLVMNDLTLGPQSIIAGTGTVTNINMITAGFISPGYSPGIITFTNDYNNPGSTFLMEIAGLGGAGAVDGHDQIVFQGTTNTVNGVDLNLSLIDGYTSQVGDIFTLISGPVTGTFNSISFPDANQWTVSYNANDITIEMTAIANSGHVGFGTYNPAATIHVNGGDVYLETINSGVILSDTNGLCHRITVETDGTLTTTIIDCPN